jgi:hypothetical protein
LHALTNEPLLRLVEAVHADRVHRKKDLWSWFPRSIEPAAGDDPPNRSPVSSQFGESFRRSAMTPVSRLRVNDT